MGACSLVSNADNHSRKDSSCTCMCVRRVRSHNSVCLATQLPLRCCIDSSRLPLQIWLPVRCAVHLRASRLVSSRIRVRAALAVPRRTSTASSKNGHENQHTREAVAGTLVNSIHCCPSSTKLKDTRSCKPARNRKRRPHNFLSRSCPQQQSSPQDHPPALPHPHGPVRWARS